MRFQYSSSSLLLVVAFVSISLGGAISAWHRLSDPSDRVNNLLLALAFFSPFWVPFAVGAYAIGRRQITVRIVLALAVIEAAAVALALLMKQWAL